MRLRSIFALSFLFIASLALGQSTTVTLQVTDGDGQTWNNGSWSAQLVSLPGATPGPPFNILGGPPVPNQRQFGTLSGTGQATIILTPNGSIGPANSIWAFAVCPNATTDCYRQQVTIVGVTQTVALTPPGIRINGAFAPPTTLAYLDGEILSPPQGAQYFNVTSLTERLWNGTIWADIGTGGGGGGTGTILTPGCIGTPLTYFPNGTATTVNGDCKMSTDTNGNGSMSSLTTTDNTHSGFTTYLDGPNVAPPAPASSGFQFYSLSGNPILTAGTAATNSTNVDSPQFTIQSQYFNGSSLPDKWFFQSQVRPQGGGASSRSTLHLYHTGTTGGTNGSNYGFVISGDQSISDCQHDDVSGFTTNPINCWAFGGGSSLTGTGADVNILSTTSSGSGRTRILQGNIVRNLGGGTPFFNILANDVLAAGTGDWGIIGCRPVNCTTYFYATNWSTNLPDLYLGGTSSLGPSGAALHIQIDSPGSPGGRILSEFYGDARSVPILVANLSTCAAGLEGAMRSVTNSTTVTLGATIAGGGTNHVKAYCNGTNWVVGEGGSGGGGGGGLGDPGGNGVVIRSALNTTVNRTLSTADSTHISITNPDGTGGNPTFDTGSNVMLDNATNTLTSAGKIDASAAAATTGLRLPNAAGAAPTVDGNIAQDTTTHTLRCGNGTTTTRCMVVALIGSAANTTAPLSSTQFTKIVGGTSINGSTEVSVREMLPFTGTLSNLCVTTSATQNASGSLVITIKDSTSASSAGTMTVTFPATQTATTICDNINSDSVTAQHDYVIQFVNNATTVSAAVEGISMVYTY